MTTETETIKQWKEVVKCNIYEGYGKTETSPVLTIQPINDNLRVGFVGLPLMNTKLRV